MPLIDSFTYGPDDSFITNGMAWDESVSPTSTTTEKGAPSCATTGSHLLNYMFKGVRGITTEQINDYLTGAMRENATDTLRLIFFKRDCRGGSGERQMFYQSLLWLLEHDHVADVRANMKHIPEYGSWKDYLRVFAGTPMEGEMLAIIAEQLRIDALVLDKEKRGEGRGEVTLAGKYAPSENDSYDKKFRVARKLMNIMGLRPKQYRLMLTSLRQRIGIVESKMCSDHWNAIDFSTVPSVAFSRYRSAFQKHEPLRFQEFISKVMKGEAKINTSVLYPHDIGGPYIRRDTRQVDPVIEAQWKQYLSGTRIRGMKTVKSLAVVDVSGSMTGTPMEMAIMLGVFMAEMLPPTSPFYRKWITFSTTPTLESLRGETLFEMVGHMQRAHWQMSTNVISVFELILKTARNQEDLPTDLFIFSDMQFDDACGHPNSTTFQAVNIMFERAGFTRPNLHFWNLRGETTDFPVENENENGVTLLSGASPDLLSFIAEGEVPTPMKMLRRILDSPRYERIKVAQEPVPRYSAVSINVDADVGVTRDVDSTSVAPSPPTPPTTPTPSITTSEVVASSSAPAAVTPNSIQPMSSIHECVIC